MFDPVQPQGLTRCGKRRRARPESPLAVRYHGGKFDIWVNNTLVIADAYPNPDGGNLFSEDDVLTVDLESWRNKTTYSNLTFGETRPEAADWRQTADTSYQSVSLSNNAGLTIDAAGRQKLFVTASMRIPMVDYDDSRRASCSAERTVWACLSGCRP